MSRIPSITLYTNDTYPVINITLNKSDGSGPMDLTGASAKCYMKLYGGSTNVFSGSQANCTITSTVNGTISYTLPSAITDPGPYIGQIVVDFGSGHVQRSERFEVKVLEGIAAT